ncbi:MAG: hypothetical protein GY859_23565 [Desulfobacterales bacterium]|nr:hypothetical protein [Desulfobacterales bacterium]
MQTHGHAPGKQNAAPSETRAMVRKRVFDSFAEVTATDMRGRHGDAGYKKIMPGHTRAAPLDPFIYIGVIGVDRIAADLKHPLKPDSLQDPDGLARCMTFIFGPRKTADIELTMVHGGRGLRELHFFVITGEGVDG